MNPISINLPPGVEVANYLYPKMDPEDLTQDIITVRLPNDYYIDVGWYPECDPNGRFVIRVFQGFWDNQKLDTPMTTKDPLEVIFAVEKLARHYLRSQIPVLASGAAPPTRVVMPM